MKKRKTVYICDHCGAAALQESYFSMGDTWKGPPKYWTKLGKEDLCPQCSKIYKELKEKIELMKKNELLLCKGREVMIYIYESHLGGLYVKTEELDNDMLYCEECGDSDQLLFESDNIYDIAEFLKDKTSIFNTGGYTYEHTLNIMKQCYSILEGKEPYKNEYEESLEEIRCF